MTRGVWESDTYGAMDTDTEYPLRHTLTSGERGNRCYHEGSAHRIWKSFFEENRERKALIFDKCIILCCRQDDPQD